MKRGDVYLANMDPTKGSEQAGMRPVVIFQDNRLILMSRTVVVIPFTTNLQRQSLPSCVLVKSGNGGLAKDSVALCHQIRVLDKSGIVKFIGSLSPGAMNALERTTLATLGIMS